MAITTDVTRILPGVIAGPGAPAAPPATDAGKGPSFGSVLKDSLAQVNQLQHDADHAISDLATGGPTSLHDTMLALEKADLSFRLMMQVRNKIVEAYQEVLRMQV
jgi:flagellar hook-basal body complex protein FliE